MRAVVELLGHGRGKVLLFCWLGWVFDLYDLMLFAFLKRDIAFDLGLDLLSQVAWIDGLTLGATAVGGFAFGRVADRVGRRVALTTSITLFSAGTLATAFADGFWGLLLARVVTGIGAGGEWGVGHATVAEAYPENLRTRAAGLLQAGSPVAIALAATVGCFVAPDVGWRNCFLWSSVLAVLALFGRACLSGPDFAPGRTIGSVLDLFRGRYARSSTVLFALLCLHMTGFWCTYAWLPSLLAQDAGWAPATIGWFQIGVSAVHVVADVSFGFLAGAFGRRRMFALFCIVFAVGLVSVALGFGALTSSPVAFGAAMAAVGIGAGTWSCFGPLFAELYPSAIRATAASGFYNSARGAQLVSQPMMGALFGWTGSFAIALYVGAVTAVLSAVVVYALPASSEVKS